MRASYDGFTPSVQVHGNGGTVGSTADVATCAVGRAPGSGSGAASWLAIAGVALAGGALARRRRAVPVDLGR